MENTDKIELSYMAGVLDGDGSISLIKRSAKKGSQSPLYYPCIQLGSLSKDLTEYFKTKLGGWTGIIKGKVCKDGTVRRDFFIWMARQSSKCLIVLEKISPFLVIKKERADFLLKYIPENPFIRGRNRLSFETLELREFAYLRMKQFNSSKTKKIGFSRKTASCPTENEFFWAYMAGLLDTDGSFSIRKMKPSGESVSNRYSSMILLSMNDITGLNFIKENCPYGNFSLIKARTCVSGFTYRWRIGSIEDVIMTLKRVVPYLRVKKEGAKILLHFCENITPVEYRQGRVPKEEIEFRENCYQQLISFNKCGVNKPSLIDLEARQGDRAEGESHGKRLSERASENMSTIVDTEDAIV